MSEQCDLTPHEQELIFIGCLTLRYKELNVSKSQFNELIGSSGKYVKRAVDIWLDYDLDPETHDDAVQVAEKVSKYIVSLKELIPSGTVQISSMPDEIKRFRGLALRYKTELLSRDRDVHQPSVREQPRDSSDISKEKYDSVCKKYAKLMDDYNELVSKHNILKKKFTQMKSLQF